MKGIMHRMKKSGIFMAFLLAFTLVFGLAANVRADGETGEPYDGDAKGSITVALPELEGASRKDVQVYLYQVGDLDTSKGYLEFSLVDALKGLAGLDQVDLNDITTPQANEEVAEALAEVIADSGIEATELWTDADGIAEFNGLTQGMYLIVQGSSNAYGTFAPFVVPVPYADETSWNYNVTVEPKASLATTMGRIDVTKTVKGIYDGVLQDNTHATNATYYIGLFMDPSGTKPYQGAGGHYKQVNIIEGSSGVISFDNIRITDQPYYIYETDADGNAIAYLTEQGTDEDPFYCMAGEDILAEGRNTAPVIVLEDEIDGIGNAVISNVYTDGLPDGFYYTGEITISKSVMDEGQMITSNDVFYAGIFAMDAQGNRAATPTEVVKLANNSTVTVEVPLGGADGTEPVTYAVLETDENGTPIDKQSFPYTVTGEGNVSLSMDQQEATVNLVNTLGGGEGYYQEEPSTQAPSTTDPGSGNDKNTGGDRSSSGTRRSTTSKKTGDDNQILLYAGLLAAAVIIGGTVVVRRRRRNG